MNTLMNRIPAIYLLVASFLYAIPDFNALSWVFLLYSLAFLIWPQSFLRMLTAVLLGLLTAFLTLAWISELSEFGNISAALPLFTGGLILILTHGIVVYKLVNQRDSSKWSSANH